MEVQETRLPGLGLRYDFNTRHDGPIGVIIYNTGRRDIVTYDRDDPDSSRTLLSLTEDEAETLAELLGFVRIAGPLSDLQQRIKGLAIDWLPIDVGGRFDHKPLADTQARTKTGASIVAVIRGDDAFPSPTPDFVFEGGDTIVVVGTPAGIRTLNEILGN